MSPSAVCFGARWDRLLRISTPFTCVLALVVAVALPVVNGWMWLVKATLPMVIAVCWALAPKGYRVENGELIVDRRVGSRHIPLQGLQQARRMDAAELRGAVRIWGVGGCFGYYGRFLNGIESQTWMVTDRQACVRLECDLGVFVISPSDPAACVAALAGCCARQSHG